MTEQQVAPILSPPGRFGGNIDDWRIGKGGTMYYKVEVPGAQIVVGDTHAAQGDSELAGTAMETSMTTKLRVTLHKAGSLPKAPTCTCR
jgi:acetamidase/formamidase